MINGLFAYQPSTGAPRLVALYNGSLWTWDGTSVTEYSAVTLHASALASMVQVRDVVYGTFGAGSIFKFDGTTVSEPAINDASDTALTAVSDLVYLRGRLWYAKGDQIHFSEAGSPETINHPSLRVREGGGDAILRLLSYRNNFLLVFKGSDGGAGSIHVLDVRDNFPNSFNLQPLYDDLAIVSPRSITRAGTHEDSDIFYVTREGVRSLRFTALDKITTPSLPFTDNISDFMKSLTYNNLDAAHAVVFNDELLWFVPVDSSTVPNEVAAYTLKIPKQDLRQGWTIIDMMPASTSAIIGFSGKPKLYLGSNTTNEIKEAFAVEGTTPSEEISKRNDFGSPYQDKTPQKLYLTLDRGSRGSIKVFLIYDDGTQYEIGTHTITASGLTLPFTLPAVLSATGTITPPAFDLRYDVDGVRLPRFKDVRVKLTTNDYIRVLGYEMHAFIETYRPIGLTESTVTTVASGSFDEETVTAETLTME